ncbi:HesB/YadR/YfhF family protein [Bacillus sp. CGMCC 1.16607]|uniref:HesB/YadR/YfhF family protein n=1 Tax=Bacillus sp. CGMCC 1.16607 TaxID=3351842 RepID=UPI00363038A5
MKIEVTKDAADWYKSEMSLQNGDKIRFFVRYGGLSTVQKGFSLGIEKEEPTDIGAKTTVEGILFYIEEKDLWYFDNHDLRVKLNTKWEEPEFEYSL